MSLQRAKSASQCAWSPAVQAGARLSAPSCFIKLNKNHRFWSSLIGFYKSSSTFIKFDQIWSSLIKFDQIWLNLKNVDQTLINFHQTWYILWRSSHLNIFSLNVNEFHEIFQRFIKFAPAARQECVAVRMERGRASGSAPERPQLSPVGNVDFELKTKFAYIKVS